MTFTLFELISFQLYYWYQPTDLNASFTFFVAELQLPEPVRDFVLRIVFDRKNYKHLKKHIVQKWLQDNFPPKENPSATPSTATILQSTSLIST